MKRESSKLRQELQRAGLKALRKTLEYLPDQQSGNTSEHGFIAFPKYSERKQYPYKPDEIVKSDLPKRLAGFVPVGEAISSPVGGRATVLKVERLNPSEPFRRFEEMHVTYNMIRKGFKPEKRTAIYVKQHRTNLETLNALAEHFFNHKTFPRGEEPGQGSFNRHSQWADAYHEFEEFSPHVALLAELEPRLSKFGSALRHVILWHAEMAYHLGLRVREAELQNYQSRAAGVRTGGSKGGSKRAETERKHASTWQAKFAVWLKDSLQNGKYEQWWLEEKKRPLRRGSIESICHYAKQRWPDEGFQGSIGKRDQKVSQSLKTLRKLVSRVVPAELHRKGLEGISKT